MTVKFSDPSRPGFETIRKSDDFQEPATAGEERYDTEYARRERRIVSLQEQIQSAIVTTETEINAALDRKDTATAARLAEEVSELTLRLHQLRAAREGVFSKLELAGIAKAEARERDASSSNRLLPVNTMTRDQIAKDAEGAAGAKKATLAKTEQSRGRIKDPLGLANLTSMGVRNSHLV